MTSSVRLVTIAIGLAALAALAALTVGQLSAQTSPQAPSAASAKKPVLKKQRLGSIKQVHALGDIYLTGQPTPDDLALLKGHGIKTIISLRHTQELPWDEATAVRQHGMRFVHVPFQSPEQLKTETFDKVLKALRDKQRGPTVLHCGSANRVGAMWYVYRILDGKIDPDAAAKEAKTAGLRNPKYLERAQAYVKRQKESGKQDQASQGSSAGN